MAVRNMMDALQDTPHGGNQKHGFPLSHYIDYHTKLGQYVPVSFIETVPNGEYSIGVDATTMSKLFNTSNFAHLKENYYFIHVPYSLINRNAYQTLVNRKQEYSALSMGIDQFPVFPLGDVVYKAMEIALDDNPRDSYLDEHGFNIGANAFRLFDMLGYGNYCDFLEMGLTLNEGGTINGLNKARFLSQFRVYCNNINRRPTANLLCAYQWCWYAFFRNDIYDNEVSPRCYNLDDVTYLAAGQNTVDYNILSHRTAEQFVLECCRLRYMPYKKDVFTAAMPGTQYGAVSSVQLKNQIPLTTSIYGYTSYVGSGENGSDGSSGARGYATGYMGQPTASMNRTGSNNLIKVTDGWKIDGGVNPNTSFYNESPKVGTNATSDNAQSSAVGTHLYLGSGENAVALTHRHHFAGSGSALASAGVNLFDVLQLVEANAIQRWRQKSMLAGNKTVDQFRAHHGVVPRHLIDHIPDFVGSVDNILNVSQVTSMANTDTVQGQNNLGDIRGRGYGVSDSRTFKYHSTDYGVLMVLYAILPENTYNAYGLDPANTRIYYTDFFQSEYQNIGLQAVDKIFLDSSCGFYSQSSMNEEHSSSDTFHSDQIMGDLVGFAPRDWAYKQKVSKVHGLFGSSRIRVLDTQGTQYYNPSDSIFGYSDMQSFAMPRKDFENIWQFNTGSSATLYDFYMNLSKLYVNPHLLDSVVALDANDSFTSDMFFTHAKIICNSVQPMSVLGLPQF